MSNQRKIKRKNLIISKQNNSRRRNEMELSTLKNLKSVRFILFLIFGFFAFTIIGCEDNPIAGRDENNGPLTVYVSVEYIPSINLNDHSWQTLRTLWGEMSSDDFDVTHTRVEWKSDMFWVVYDTTGYFKIDCRTCETGTWYDTDGSTENMSYDFHTMSPVTNQVSLVDDEGVFGNVIAPVRSMRGDAMWLWWSINNTVLDSMLIVLE
tara:strand:- start:561 stop:1184 length:624 start_codon:yes stop_codon:yes gene_type:complete